MCLNPPMNQKVFPKRNPSLHNSYYNPPPHNDSVAAGQILQYRTGELYINKTLRNTRRLPNSLAIIGEHRNKTFVKIGPNTWIETPHINPLPNSLLEKAVKFFCSTIPDTS